MSTGKSWTSSNSSMTTGGVHRKNASHTQSTSGANAPPVSLEVVHRVVEHDATRFHRTVEAIFEKYNLVGNQHRFQFDGAFSLVGKIFDTYSVKASNIVTWTDFEALCHRHASVLRVYKSEPDFEVLRSFGKLVEEFARLFNLLNRRLTPAFRDHLLLYCVSLASIQLTTIDLIDAYEDFIGRNRPEILAEMRDLKALDAEWRDYTRDFYFALEHGDDVMACIGRARAAINKLYYYAIEWVEEDRRFALNLQTEFNNAIQQRDSLRRRLESLQQITKSNELTLTGLQSQLGIDQRIGHRLRGKLRRCQRSQEVLRQRIDTTLGEQGVQLREMEAVLSRLCRLEARRQKCQKRRDSAARVCRELNWADSDKETCEVRMTRVDVSCKALKRQAERLIQLESKLRLFLREKEDQMDGRRREEASLRGGIEDRRSQTEVMIQEMSVLEDRVADLRILNEKKRSTSALRELHSFGRVVHGSKKSSSTMTEVCEIVARQIGPQWKDLYMALPMKPERPPDRRSADVELIDILAAKNDVILSDQAMNSLKKWRLFFHKAGPEHLVSGLRKIKRMDLAMLVDPSLANK